MKLDLLSQRDFHFMKSKLRFLEQKAGRAGGILIDLALVCLLVALAIIFMDQNGFIGPSDIQPYPY